MNCPVCNNVNLVMSERQGIEIDYCPQCRGVWLDRGELDKIIERSTNVAPSRKIESASPVYSSNQHPPRQEYHGSPHGGHYKKKKEGFLSDLFDFD